MYWLHKFHKTPVGARLIIVFKNCSSKPLSGVISKNFKTLFKHFENFHNESPIYWSYKKFCVLENSFPIIEKLNIINASKSAEKYSTYNFSTLYATIPHNLLIKFLSEITYFVFKSKVVVILDFQELLCIGLPEV